MSEQFKVGEIVVGCNHAIDLEFNGMEAEITIPLEMRSWQGITSGVRGREPCYGVIWSNGLRSLASPHQLRRRKPPTEYKGEQMLAALIRETLDKAPQRVREPA